VVTGTAIMAMTAISGCCQVSPYLNPGVEIPLFTCHLPQLTRLLQVFFGRLLIYLLYDCRNRHHETGTKLLINFIPDGW